MSLVEFKKWLGYVASLFLASRSRYTLSVLKSGHSEILILTVISIRVMFSMVI